MQDKIYYIGNTIAGLAVVAVGGYDTLLITFLVIMFLDMATGILHALSEGEYRSNRFRQGLYTKAGYIIAIILVVQLDNITNNSGVFRSIMIMFLVTNEMISIIENLGRMGVPFPKKITEAIQVLKDQSDKE